jgi:hypothetical protein
MTQNVKEWRNTAWGGASRKAWEHRNYKTNVKARTQNWISHLKRLYKITRVDFDKMLVDQLGCCAICKEQMTGFGEPNVDHCHATLKVRGLLCRRCNYVLGRIKDSKEILRSAEVYLG